LFDDKLHSGFRIAAPTPVGPALSWIAADVVHRLSIGEVGSERLDPIYLREHDGAKARAAAAVLP